MGRPRRRLGGLTAVTGLGVRLDLIKCPCDHGLEAGNKQLKVHAAVVNRPSRAAAHPQLRAVITSVYLLRGQAIC